MNSRNSKPRPKEAHINASKRVGAQTILSEEGKNLTFELRRRESLEA